MKRMRPKGPNTKVLNSADAAERLDVTPSTLSRMRAAGRGPRYVQDGGLIRYRADIIERYLAGDEDARMDSKPQTPDTRVHTGRAGRPRNVHA
jgi:Helix-turn-helix domain